MMLAPAQEGDADSLSPRLAFIADCKKVATPAFSKKKKKKKKKSVQNFVSAT